MKRIFYLMATGKEPSMKEERLKAYSNCLIRKEARAENRNGVMAVMSAITQTSSVILAYLSWTASAKMYSPSPPSISSLLRLLSSSICTSNISATHSHL